MHRYTFVALAVVGVVGAAILSVFWSWAQIVLGVFLALTLLGIWDLVQTRHAILRNFPIIGHMRWLLEAIRPEIRQYFIESDADEAPFSRKERSLVYQRAKNTEDKHPFGTQDVVYGPGYMWLCHSIAPRHLEGHDFRVRVGGPSCTKPYDASLYNVSAMSFGALSANAIRALNEGAKMGGFAHDTGEGGISRHHRAGGGDLIYQLGTGYFGSCTQPGVFSPERFETQAASDQVRMIEVKLSQGAKPGHGGVLPAAKITDEIAEARGIPKGADCVSPPGHSTFSTPVELLQFIEQLRTLSGGKPIGFKLCIGQHHEFMAIVKAMLETGYTPDFIVVDGAEGGTGAAPVEFTDHVGEPLLDALSFVHNALVGAGLRDRVRIGASGKVVTAFDILRACALGADWCNAARGFMFSVGCIQSRSCHTNRCPTGVATQDPLLQRGLVVADKAPRAAQFHQNTMKAVGEMLGAAGLSHPSELGLMHLRVRLASGKIATGTAAFRFIEPGSLLDGSCDEPVFTAAWTGSSAYTFERVGAQSAQVAA